METLNLVKILKGCPMGTKLYSPLFGEVIFKRVLHDGNDYMIEALSAYTKARVSFTADGRYYESEQDGERMLFPSKDCRDWSQFKHPQQFQRGDHILWRGKDGGEFVGAFAEFKDDSKCEVFHWKGYYSSIEVVSIDELTKIEKFDPKWLKPGDAVLVRDCNIVSDWMYSTFSHITFEDGKPYYIASCSSWEMCVPYNCETKHLLGTTDDATEFYKI